MNCNEASELLAAAVLGDLDRDERRAVHAHLATCDRCLEEESELFESMRLLRAHAGDEPGVDIHDSVMTLAADSTPTRVRAFRHPAQPVGWLPRTLLTAAATALIVVGLQTVFESRPPGPGPVPSDAVHGPALAHQSPQPAISLLEGTLFDRRRNVPAELRQWRVAKRSDERSRS